MSDESSVSRLLDDHYQADERAHRIATIAAESLVRTEGVPTAQASLRSRQAQATTCGRALSIWSGTAWLRSEGMTTTGSWYGWSPRMRSQHGARGHTDHHIGEGHGRAKWPDAAVTRAWELYAEGLSYASVGRLLGVPWRTVARGIRGDTRRGVA